MAQMCFVSCFSRDDTLDRQKKATFLFLFHLGYCRFTIVLALLSSFERSLNSLSTFFSWSSCSVVGHLFRGIQLICTVTLYSLFATLLPDGKVLNTRLCRGPVTMRCPPGGLDKERRRERIRESVKRGAFMPLFTRCNTGPRMCL